MLNTHSIDSDSIDSDFHKSVYKFLLNMDPPSPSDVLDIFYNVGH